MQKLGTAAGCMLLIGALAAPVAFAHYDSGDHPLPYATTGLDIFGQDENSCGTQTAVSTFGFVGPNCANPALAGGNTDRVSGWYVGSIDVYAELNTDSGFTVGGPSLSECAALDVSPPDTTPLAAICTALTGPINPGFLFATALALGDVEIGGTGDCTGALASTAAMNEETVDGKPGLGSVPDGLWNDGGNGFITHTDHYACADWNTAGCAQYAPAKAEDMISGEDLWIQTVCNWGIPTAGAGPTIDQVIFQFVGDVINCPLGGFPQSCIDAVNYLNDCLGNPIIVLPATNSCQGGSTGILCGNGSIGTSNFGRGGGADGTGVAFGAAGVSVPGGVNCDSVATASVLPYTAVVVQLDASGAIQAQAGDISVASYGWVA